MPAGVDIPRESANPLLAAPLITKEPKISTQIVLKHISAGTLVSREESEKFSKCNMLRECRRRESNPHDAKHLGILSRASVFPVLSEILLKPLKQKRISQSDVCVLFEGFQAFLYSNSTQARVGALCHASRVGRRCGVK